MSTPGWEAVKENAAPLQRGRNVNTLEQAGSTSRGFGSVLKSKTDDSDSQTERIDQFEKRVQPCEALHVTEVPNNEDVLSDWMTYIKYCQENFPSDTHRQFLLMERCTRALVKIPQYANDDRFISVCAKYADKTKEPAQVFKYLHQQKVGQKTALFWVAWAFVAEKDGDYPFAEQIFKKGISKEAQPMNMLKVRHKQFQRRMSRHWLNSSQQNDQLDDCDEEEQSRVSRGALGGLSRDRIRRNDRARVGSQLRQRSRAGTRCIPGATGRGSQSAPNNTNTAGSFSIFVENEGENAPNSFLDQPIVENKRVIEREVDRRKENTLEAERWNERGGLMRAPGSAAAGYLSRSSHGRTASRGAPLPFAVFVDEECAVHHENEEAALKLQSDIHRKARDERTFRERKDEGLAERLTRDPLRYVRDPSQFDTDQALAEHAYVKEEAGSLQPKQKTEKPIKRAAIGFNKKLLKDAIGAEQCFEEARATSKCFTLSQPSVNFNLLQNVIADQSSQMDLDEGNSQDISMCVLSMPSEGASFEEQPRKVQRLDGKSQGRVLFKMDPSLDNSLNYTAISTASSDIQAMHPVGVPTHREEETINTKFAMKELSMMFSSPAFGVDEVARRTENQAIEDDDLNRSAEINGSFANVGDGIGHSMLDNSILNINDENAGPKNPLARSTATPDFGKKALQELPSDSDAEDDHLNCRSRRPHAVSGSLQEDPLRFAESASDDREDFQIYEDPKLVQDNVSNDVFNSEKQRSNENASDKFKEDGPQPTFTIFEDSEKEQQESSSTSESFTVGDTATFSLIRGLTNSEENSQAMASSSGRPSSIGVSEQGDTATLSIFRDEIFHDSNQSNGVDSKNVESGFSIFVDDDCDQNQATSPKHLRDYFRESTDNEGPSVDYNQKQEHVAKMALRRLQASSSVATDSRSPLLTLLSLKGQSFHLPHITLPREFRSKYITGNTSVQIGKHSGVMSCELGRGAYGVVVLMNVVDKSDDQRDTIAVKAQSPTDCLAREYEMLRILEKRTERMQNKFAFPRALSFLSLADGAILSMSAGSESGLNLVDLANVYKLKLGEHVPEIVTLHYVSRMLRHLEELHWHGKILHCDIKPDNFVLCTIRDGDNTMRDIAYSDLMLVDFGRAVDMEDHCDNSKHVRSVLFHGKACHDEMQCVAMRNGKSWSYDVDTYGILACAHVMLFGTHIKLRQGRNKKWYLANSFKRYWQKDLWTKIFDALLNFDEDSGAAVGSHARNLRTLRHDVDEYIGANSNKLQSFLTRQLSLLPTRRDQLS